MPRRSALVAFLLLLSTGRGARAQELPPTEPVRGLPGSPVELDLSGARWAVIFADGAVRVHRPGAVDGTLRPIRQVGAEADDAVLRVEGLLSDLEGAGEEGFGAIEVDEEDLGEVELPDAEEQVEELLQGETSLAERGVEGSVQARIRWGVGDRLAISRADGVWVSEDAGGRWRRLDRRPALALADTGASWARLLPSGEVWIDDRRDTPSLRTLRVHVWDLASSDGTLWAATELGLWRRAPGEDWTPAGDLLDPLVDLEADPGWEGGLWALGPTGILRTDDGGQSWRNLGPEGPRGGILRWGGPAPGGGLLVVGPTGLWLHQEGRWTFDPRQARAAVRTEAGLYLIQDGLLRVPPRPEGQAGAAPPPWIALGDLLHTALSRRELAEAVRAGRVLQTALPEVVLEGQLSPDQDLDYLPFTTASTGTDWKVLVRLKWTPAGRSAAGEAFEQTLEEIALRTGFDDLGIAGDRAILGAMGGRVGRRAASYRADLVDRIASLYAERNALFLRRSSGPPMDLRQQVGWELRRAELEARLDALTDGAVSAWSPGPEGAPAEPPP